jgi:hypothetical protein
MIIIDFLPPFECARVYQIDRSLELHFVTLHLPEEYWLSDLYHPVAPQPSPTILVRIPFADTFANCGQAVCCSGKVIAFASKLAAAIIHAAIETLSIATEKQPVTAVQTVVHNKDCPSYINLPIIPRR